MNHESNDLRKKAFGSLPLRRKHITAQSNIVARLKKKRRTASLFSITALLFGENGLCNHHALALNLQMIGGGRGQRTGTLHYASRTKSSTSNLFRHAKSQSKIVDCGLKNYNPSNLFRSTSRRSRNQVNRSSTGLHMVLTTPENIIEQASTLILLDDLIDESVRTISRKPVMMQFDPSSGWIWRRWKGTVFSETWQSCVRNVIIASLISIFCKLNPNFMEPLAGFDILWGQLLSVGTFTLTFFLNQAYSLWRKCYGYSRRLQGRLNDLAMTLAAHAARTTPENGERSTYTEPARQVLELMARYIRVFNILTYASFTGSHRPILTPQGMRRLVDRGLITEAEREVLSDAQLPVTQRHNAILLWVIRLFIDARKAGHIEGGDGFEAQFLDKCHVIRAQYGAIGDELQGRMPLAYAHIVQVLVDVILWMYPVMAFAKQMSYLLGIAGTALLTIFYQGLFDLAKQFLDPYDNENYGKGEDPLCIDTLIAETNAGSVRWMNGFAEQPYSHQKLIEGDMLEYQLPMRGWSVEETMLREEQKLMEQARKDVEEAENNVTVEREYADELQVVHGGVSGEAEHDEEERINEEELTMEEALKEIEAEACVEKVP